MKNYNKSINEYISRRMSDTNFVWKTMPHTTAGRRWVAPSYIIELLNSGQDMKYIRSMVKEIPSIAIFEDCAQGLITAEDGARLMQIQDEPNSSVVRALKWIIGK